MVFYMQKQAKNTYYDHFQKNKVDKPPLETRIRQLFELNLWQTMT